MAGIVGQNEVLYLYGITEEELSPPPKLLGVDGRSRVSALPCAGLVCWVSRVPKKEFADDLAGNMENLDWLAGASVHHQRVVSALAEGIEILPARFGTVFLTDTSLEKHIAGNKDILRRDFSKIRGSDEWGVKVFGVPAKVELPPAQSRTGKDYLKAKATMLRTRPGRNNVSAADFDEFSEQLRKIAVETAQVGKVSGGQRGLQWQTSLLLKRDNRKKFEALLRKFSKDWAGTRQIECTGPWPPYSFISRPGDEA